ncbi:MAG: HD domain-containing protein [Anaerolineae bacterium]|nr:HD domain-containing protein [Anaerolineae bacterium]
MIRDTHIPLFDLVMSLCNAIDLISPRVVGHQKRVAHIAYSVAREMNFAPRERNLLLLAGALHDSGALSLRERLEALDFEVKDPHRHAKVGYLLFRDFSPLAESAHFIRFHHVRWENGKGEMFEGQAVPEGSQILHLADRVEVLIKKDIPILEQAKTICETIRPQSGRMFHPQHVEAFLSCAQRESFWLDLVSEDIDAILRSEARLSVLELDMNALLELGHLFAHLIDFRSRFTVAHSCGVASTAEILAQRMGFSRRGYQTLRVAGYLHDLGKLAVPKEVLEKPGPLSPQEWNLMRTHTYHTYRTLATVKDLEDVNAYAACHHERLDGNGYPFHYTGDALPLGARIMAVADVFTALMEDRPYRPGMERDETLKMMRIMTKNGELDGQIMELLEENVEEIDQRRIEVQRNAWQFYHQKEASEKALGN